MKAAPQAQRALLALQAIDTAIAQLNHRRRTLPEHARIAEASRQRARLGEDLVAARTTVSDLEGELDKAESDLVPVKERRARDQRHLDAGAVTDPRQLQALIDEIAHLKRRISDLEDIQLEAMERLDEASAVRARVQAERSAIDDQLRAELASRDSQLADLDAQLAAQAAQRETAAGALPADLVVLYQRIAERSGGVGAALLKGRRCGGCQLEATASALNAYQAAAPDDVVRCEECDRILVREG
jgi:predicted  nucleic acid-binding Zn-ribbon protein